MPTRWALIGVVSMSVCVPLAVASCGTTQEAGTGQGSDSGNGATGDGSADSTAQDGSGGSVHDTGRADRARSDSAGDDDSGDDSMPDDAGDGDGDAPTETPDAPACVPGCPTGVTCGVWKDCSGVTIVCGEPCTTGHVCLLTSHSPAAQSCQPTPACAGKCGVVNQDVCGVGVSCGGCTGGNSCVNNVCVPPTGGDGGCSAPVCAPGNGLKLCGTVSNTCGDSISCACPAGEKCTGGVCGPPPPECNLGDGGVDGGLKCGSVENACGSGTIACWGGCTGDTKCESNVCTTCAAPTCGTATCGSVNNGCGPSVSCGPSCGPDVCYDGQCCVPSTCSGVVGCAPVSLGCGVTKSCNPCATGDVCDKDSGTCSKCIPKTCSDYGGEGCGHPDTCGGTLDCCSANTTCSSGICCPSGQVAYEGTCCQPACTGGALGPQVSCGVTIYCND